MTNIDFHGLTIVVEKPKGSVRKYQGGQTKLKNDYGYIKDTDGMDGEDVDVYVGPNLDSAKIFVVTQMKKPDFKEVDEEKVMIGFSDKQSAKEAYTSHYDKDFFGGIKEMSLKKFKQHINKGVVIKGLLLDNSLFGKINLSKGSSLGIYKETHMSDAQKLLSSALDILKSVKASLEREPKDLPQPESEISKALAEVANQPSSLRQKMNAVYMIGQAAGQQAYIPPSEPKHVSPSEVGLGKKGVRSDHHFQAPDNSWRKYK